MRRCLLVIAHTVCAARALGRMQEPPARGSLWRFGYDSPVNVNDSYTDCGGTERLWHLNGGNCGMCGDAFDLPVPRPHEIGGVYGQGLITRRYEPGQYIDVELNFTGQLGGYFQFSVCKIEDYPVDRKRAVKQIKCRSRRPLDTEETGEPLYSITVPRNYYKLRVKLPRRYQCHWCVLVWEYWTGSPCGLDQDCNVPQGQLKSCADIMILNNHVEGKYSLALTTTTTTTESDEPLKFSERKTEDVNVNGIDFYAKYLV
ncbi:uncharacterized protein LOC100904863 [Galendromus occidentalis]|uniref:Uncharacterized protein LOC100904863 n=1 Tax=Galendromus occidentalis TaxID=34638 RepID=A0AAJ6QVK8_9ACAR|nr:uncharacterized protein LOC100904863 [Galendromus occidentalis]